MKNLNEMRIQAQEQLKLLKEGKVDYQDVKAFCEVSHLILLSLKIEMEYLRKLPDVTRRINFIEGEHAKQLLEKI